MLISFLMALLLSVSVVNMSAVSAEETETREVSFTTGSAGTVYNMSFDDWYQDGKVWYPYAKGANPTVWDSANKGAATYIGSSTSPASSKYPSITAVKKS